MIAPPGMGEYEALVNATDAPAVLMVDRDLQRALFAYVRNLERELAAAYAYMRECEAREPAGSFW